MTKAEWPSHIKKRKIPLYGGNLVIVRSHKDHKAVTSFLEDDCSPPAKDEAGGTVHLTDSKGSAYYLVGVYAGGTQCLVHELAHVAFMVLANCGVPVSRKGHNEAYCYLLDALFGLATKQEKS
jgi:hypothetical protein